MKFVLLLDVAFKLERRDKVQSAEVSNMKKARSKKP
jgi:hypothetical protein